MRVARRLPGVTRIGRRETVNRSDRFSENEADCWPCGRGVCVEDNKIKGLPLIGILTSWSATLAAVRCIRGCGCGQVVAVFLTRRKELYYHIFFIIFSQPPRFAGRASERCRSTNVMTCTCELDLQPFEGVSCRPAHPTLLIRPSLWRIAAGGHHVHHGEQPPGHC